jgi:hypothetical protein
MGLIDLDKSHFYQSTSALKEEEGRDPFNALQVISINLRHIITVSFGGSMEFYFNFFFVSFTL